MGKAAIPRLLYQAHTLGLVIPLDQFTNMANASVDDPTIAFSAIDERFDQNLLRQLQDVTTDDRILCVSALSRYSRNSAKLHRILEYLLAHGATILTTNYLIRRTDLWIRRGDLVKPIATIRMPGSRKRTASPAPTARSSPR
jgi:hypothetical protein